VVKERDGGWRLAVMVVVVVSGFGLGLVRAAAVVVGGVAVVEKRNPLGRRRRERRWKVRW
jgi:hypothetical protein